jgi:hypothetical protein
MRWAALYRPPPILRRVSASQFGADHAPNRAGKRTLAEKEAATPIQDLMPLPRGLNEQTHMTDAKAFIGWLDQQPSVAKNKKIGTQGYCAPVGCCTCRQMLMSARTSDCGE